MLRIVLLTVLATLAEPRYIDNLATEEKIVGGEIAKPNSWPWQVSIQYYSSDAYYHACGGSLIRPGWVLTAAHCVIRPTSWRVVLGDHDISYYEETEQYIKVYEVKFHAYFDKNNVAAGYDVALLKLSNEATLNSYVQLAPLPPFKQILPHNNPCYITGWGLMETGGLLSAELKQAYLPVVDHEICSRSDWWGSKVKNTMICGGDGSLAGCQGDSGGPLNCLVNGQYVLHGITSFWAPEVCSAYQKPTVFTRVSAYVDWITINMGEWDYE